MFHIELRQFPHVARAFNLTEQELREKVLTPWVAGQMVDWGDRKWAPERARLTIYEGPELRSDEIGMGRGWANATRAGEDVTERVLAQAQRPEVQEAALDQFKQEILGLCGAAGIDIRETVRLAGALHPQSRVSDRLALAERAIWELLHAGRVRMVQLAGAEDEGGRLVAPEQWQPVLLAWGTWGDRAAPEVFLEADEAPTPK